MKRIKDERLMLKNLKNIRIAFIVQTIGIVAILIYSGVTEGIMEITSNPLWIVLMLTMVVFLWRHLRISVDIYDDAKEQKKPGPYYKNIIISALIGTVLALIAKFIPDGSNNTEALLLGIIVFVCFLIPSTFIYYLRNKRSEDVDQRLLLNLGRLL